MGKSIDPHSVFINNESVELENLTFFVELTVTKRNRLGSSLSDKPLKINFLGVNEDGMFTTDWTENKENFGIKSISFKMTSSYVPQVDIVFLDVRGQALFNNVGNSKYKVLFDMPPPIFDLTLKGYYGQSVTYRLHLIKQYATFVNNNSYEINASFVGMTFAPLADMYVDYLEVAPYLSNETRTNSDLTYLELTERSKQLSTKIKTITEKDVKYINDIGDKNNELIAVKDNYISTFIDDIKSVYSSAVNSIFRVDIDPVKKNVINISYKYLPKASNGEKYPNQEIYEAILIQIEEKINFFGENKINFKILKEMVSFDKLPQNNLIGTGNNVITTATYVVVFSIDLSNVDLNIHQAINNNIKDIQKKGDLVKDKINKVSSEILGEGPRLSRIMNIIIDDAKTFFMSLKNVVKEAETSRAGQESTLNGDEPKYAFPNFYIDKQVNGETKRVRSLPTDPTWAEVKFINTYINAKMKAEDYKNSQNDINFDPQSGDDYNFLPINAFDTLIYADNRFTNVDKDNIADVLIRRGTVFLNMSVSVFNVTDSGLRKSGTNFIKNYAKGEAKNLINVLRTKEKLMDSFLLEIGKPNFTFQAADTPINKLIDQGNLRSITDATNNIIYNDSFNLDIKTEDELNSFMGVPRLKEPSEYNEENIKAIDEILRSGLNNDSGYFCQYNIPFYVDQYFKGGFENKSDYFVSRTNGLVFIDSIRSVFADNPSIFFYRNDVNSLSKITNPNDFLMKVFIENDNVSIGRIIMPYEVPYFKYNSGMCEVPKFVLITWGYIISILGQANAPSIINNNISKWQKLPQTFRDQCLNYYNRYVIDFNSFCVLPNREFKLKLLKVETSTDQEADEESFYASSFMTDFIEMQYVNFSNNNIFTDATTVFDREDPYGYYNTYFNTLKLELLKLKYDVKKEIVNQRSEVKSKINNIDLKTELYYNFKSFVDKWMLNTPDNINGMFDINNFLMVDRAFNNIGDEVLMDLTPIYSNETTPDTSLYTLLLNLFSKNNFEFFALPSFIDYNEGGVLWNTSNINTVFGTHITANTKTDSKFICMYVGGTSSQLDVVLPSGNSHQDDSGIFDEITDLSGGDVQSFKIEFGTNTQSFFHDLKLSQLEFKETNESIRTLDDIARSDQNVTQTASNSLYNVYEQRSYTAEFNMMGNVMIQPTMYFDLSNVAMFKGTYLILEVNHEITANNFSTFFKGVRIPKVPKPYVTDYSIYANIDGLDPALLSTNTSGINPAGSAKITSADLADVKVALKSLGTIKNPNINAQEKALLDVISYAEGTLGWGSYNGYNCKHTFKEISGWKPDYQFGHGLQSWLINGSTAAGRYQFLAGTWLGSSTGTDSIGGTNLKNKAFSANNQDATCLKKINERLSVQRLSINNINQNNFVEYTDALALEWASFPYYKYKMREDPRSDKFKIGNKKWTAGQGFYSGQGGKYSKEELWLVYSISLKIYQGGSISEDNINDLVAKINAKVGDSSGRKGSVRNLVAKYGDLEVLNTNMKDSDRLVDKNKNFIKNHITKWTVPSTIKTSIKALPSVMEINKDFQTPLENVLNDLISKNLHTEIKSFDGCFNIRNQRASNVISVHAYAMAIDLNAPQNPFGGKTTFSNDFLQVWRDHGFTVGADFGRGREDGMHYEYTKIV